MILEGGEELPTYSRIHVEWVSELLKSQLVLLRQ